MSEFALLLFKLLIATAPNVCARYHRCQSLAGWLAVWLAIKYQTISFIVSFALVSLLAQISIYYNCCAVQELSNLETLWRKRRFDAEDLAAAAAET